MKRIGEWFWCLVHLRFLRDGIAIALDQQADISKLRNEVAELRLELASTEEAMSKLRAVLTTRPGPPTEVKQARRMSELRTFLQQGDDQDAVA